LQAQVEIGPLGKYEYDSKKTTRDSGSMLSGALNPVFNALNGAGWSYTLSPRGDVVKVEGFAELLTEALKGNDIGAQFAGGGTNESAKAEAAQRYLQFPDKEISPGSTWDQDYELPMPNIGKVKGRRSYKYVGDETKDGRKLAKITFTDASTIDLDVKSDMATATGSLSTSSSSGEALFDAEAGRIVSMTAKAELGGTLKVSAGGMTLSVDQTQSQAGTIELLDKLPE
jgi:hypothetical protein